MRPVAIPVSSDDAERKPGDDEHKVLEQWIQGGAEFPKATGRTPAFIDDAAALTAIRDHLRDKTKAADRPFQRLNAHALKRELWADDPEFSLFHRASTEFGHSPSTKL